MTTRERLSASVEPALLAAGHKAVAEGRAETVSAWVNDALRRQVAHDARLRAVDEFLRHYEHEHGEISEDEMNEAVRRARGRATVVRSTRQPGRKARVKRGAA
jgi:Arc/MetJ-type ribon-helix-helix transcriptional regulator